jgi:regulator of ribosome biosynthesis
MVRFDLENLLDNVNMCYRELFAKKKGIAPKQRDGKLVYDEEKQDWVPKWGYKGKNKELETDWLVEVDDKKKDKDGEEMDPRKLSRQQRKENVKKNERQQKANAKRAAGLGPRKGAGVGKSIGKNRRK